MLQYPYGINPSGSTVDTSQPFTLTSFISGTDCVAYELQILENVTGNNYYDGTKVLLPQTLYNNDELVVSVTNILPTGKDYIYNYKLWTSLADIPIVTGVILEQVSLTVFYVGQFTNIKQGHTISINGEQRLVQTYQFDATLLKGILTINEKFDNLVEDNTSFKITSDFIETPYYYFQSAKTPTIGISNIPSVVASRIFDFEGVYSQLENIPVQKYNYELFVLIGEEYVSLDKTDDIYNAKLSYTYDGFISGNAYKIRLSVTNQKAINVVYEKEFNVDYNEVITVGNLVAELNYDNHSVILTFENVDKTNILYWDIYREEVDSQVREKIGRITVDDLGIEDFGVVNRTTYKWVAIPLTTDLTAQSLESEQTTTDWSDWSIISIGENYTPNQIVKLNLNLESADMVQNLDVVYHKNYTQYPKESRGKTNYLTGSISCLLGQIIIDKQSIYTEQNFTINDWQDFVYNGELKILKDRAGNKYAVSITTSNSNVDDVSVQQINQINFSFTEIFNADDLQIVKVVV